MSFFSSHASKALVEYYNEVAPQLGRAPVARFSDRETAERRCEELRQRIRAQREAIASDSGPIAVADFNEEAEISAQGAPSEAKGPEACPTPKDACERALLGLFKTVRPGSNRAKLVIFMLAKQAEGVWVDGRDMAEAIYSDRSQVGPAKMVFSGFKKDIFANKVNKVLETKKVGTRVTYLLKELE